MKLWWRRPRADVGTYKHPPIVPLAAIESVVEEGMLVSRLAVRMVIKNSLIVGALRERLDYDFELLALETRERLILLALENETTAERLDQTERDGDGAAADADVERNDYDILLEEAHRRRPSVHRLLAAALRRDADDPTAIAALIAQARVEAADDIGSEAVRQLVRRDFGSEAGYADARAKRIQNLIAIDIARLRRPPR
ncbi:hypothetical protein BJQ94_11715 [Cryobacterium sp. SO2]|uniref:hypothetical protein n=1 Tax=Cryobacterium sp. SO2 TaxID=1897060 RepID=UPI00223E7C0E|nr:hypothetical protein [Cryobacterium sp. SO2]WEO76040.1 hypothetical protein BJQ94_11715 [Cryobacterium sp. SO2]